MKKTFNGNGLGAIERDGTPVKSITNASSQKFDHLSSLLYGFLSKILYWGKYGSIGAPWHLGHQEFKKIAYDGIGSFML